MRYNSCQFYFDRGMRVEQTLKTGQLEGAEMSRKMEEINEQTCCC